MAKTYNNVVQTCLQFSNIPIWSQPCICWPRAAAGAHHSVVCEHDVVDVEGDGAGAGESCNMQHIHTSSVYTGVWNLPRLEKIVTMSIHRGQCSSCYNDIMIVVHTRSITSSDIIPLSCCTRRIFLYWGYKELVTC